MITLTELISRLRAAEVGSRELDALIAYHIDRRWEYPWWDRRWPLFTTSIDAALTLIPDGWEYTLSVFAGGTEALLRKAGAIEIEPPYEDRLISSGNRTLPLNIVLASLMVRAS